MTLYDITNEYLMLQDMATDPDIDPEILADTMESIAGELEDKADGYAKVMKNIEGEIASLDTEIKRLTAMKRARENNVKRIKEGLQNAMITTGKTKFKTSLFSFGIQKNPASVVLDTEDLSQIPLEYLVMQDPTVNKKQLIADLKAGKDLSGIAHLEQSESLRIR